MPDRAILSFFAVLVVIAVGPWLAERVRLPGLLGLLFGGLLIGPYVLGIVQESDTFIKSLGTIGLLYLMYLAGLDLDLEILRRYKRIAITFAIITFVWPMALGFMTGLALGYKTAAALLLGSIWASHTLLTYPTFRSYGLANQRAVRGDRRRDGDHRHARPCRACARQRLQTGDASGVDAVHADHARLGSSSRRTASSRSPRIVRWLMPSLGQPPTVRYIIALAALFSAVVVCEMFGIDGIVGAFFAGLALEPAHPEVRPAVRAHRVLRLGALHPDVPRLGRAHHRAERHGRPEDPWHRCGVRDRAASAGSSSRPRSAGRSSSTRGTRSVPCSPSR